MVLVLTRPSSYLRIVLARREILLKLAHAPLTGRRGAITALQRTSSDLRLNPHLHLIALDGTWREQDGELAWEGFGHLRTSEVGEVLERLVRRLERHLRRTFEDEGEDRATYRTADSYQCLECRAAKCTGGGHTQGVRRTCRGVRCECRAPSTCLSGGEEWRNDQGSGRQGRKGRGGTVPRGSVLSGTSQGDGHRSRVCTLERT